MNLLFLQHFSNWHNTCEEGGTDPLMELLTMNAVTQIDPANVTISTDSTALPLRPHNILGVCEGLGEDFGINPLWLRVPFAASVLISPLWAVVAYLALGLVVLGSRLLFPARKSVKADETTVASVANSEIELGIAA